ncbi:MAG: ABC transporter transmembrane domain-containing protein, partial [Cyanobacteriota bacterium]|nr:ABC transporter transmembrane domain-containing protein [Cyanobacteriota bacterium]
MQSAGSHGPLKRWPAFAGLSARGLQALEAAVSVRSFSTGQILCRRDLIPAEIYLLTAGQARLVSRDQGRLCTVEKLGPGAFVGLASLLRALACEEVSAAGDVQVLAIPDAVVLQLLASEQAFATWCAGELFSAELLALVELLVAANPRRQASLPELFQEARRSARLVAPTKQTLAQLPADVVLLAASNNLPDHPLGTPLDPGAGPPRALAPLPPRLVAIAADWLRPVELADASLPEATALVPLVAEGADTPALLASGLDLGRRDQRDFRLLRGQGPLEETLACFQMLASELQLPFRRDAIEKILRDALRRGQQPDLQLCGNIAAMMGLHVSGVRVPASQATRLQTPALIPWRLGGFALVRAANARGLVIASPRDGLVHLTPAQVQEIFAEGLEFLLLERRNTTPEQRFNFSWFWPALRRYRGILLQVLLASFVVQLFSLANPLLIQVIIDKVISQRSLDTLQVLGIALVVVTLLEGLIGSLRTFLFTETTNRIDLRLGSEVIDHLLRLPLNYFDRRPVGELGTRIAELEKIRNFLTGQALTTLLDTAFSVIYIVVMVFYSWLLTLIALCVLPIQVGLTVVGAPLFRRQYRDAAQENARTQSHLVEVLTGIQTVKAQNVEMISRWKWQSLYSKYIARTFEKTITGTVLSETSQVLQKLSQLLVLWVGATLVLNGEMTLGQLIAFRIISGYVTQPLLRLSSIWQ